jgi:D-amino-acid oxidase
MVRSLTPATLREPGPGHAGVVRVVVVGSGISGLSCAVLLRRAGHEVVVVSADPPERTVSWVAAAVWFPTAAGPADAVARWGAATYDVLAAEAASGVPGVVMRESLALSHAPYDGLPDWAAAVGDVRAARSDELPPGYAHGLRFAVPLVEMPAYLPHLRAEVLRLGGTLTTRRLTRLDDVLDLRPDVVVNAAGLAAGELVGDDSVFPVRGQIVRVAAPGLGLSVRDEQHPGGRAYVHPRSDDVVLGGTLEVGRWDTDPDPAETAAILARCTDVEPRLAGARVLGTLVGLRPGRPAIRVERDLGLLPVPVVHDYGHGGSGVTVGWGCAQDVVRLVDGEGP